jgi:hypothetical protein
MKYNYQKLLNLHTNVSREFTIIFKLKYNLETIKKIQYKNL